MTVDRTTTGQRLSGREARQGEIILRQPWQRALFIAGLVGFGVLALIGGAWWAGGVG